MKLISVLFLLMSFSAFAYESDEKFLTIVYAKSCPFTQGANTSTCYCDNQNFAVGGGTFALGNSYIRYDYPVGNNGWRVGCVNVLSGAPSDCGNVYVKCMVQP